MHNCNKNPYVVRTGGFDCFALNADVADIASLRIELTWQGQHTGWQLPDELRPPGMPAHEHEQYSPIYEQKLVILRGPPDILTVTFSEGLDRRLNAPHFQYAAAKGWAYDQQALFAATDHTQTWTDVQKILITSGQWDPIRRNDANAMQLVLQGAHGEDIVTISDRFILTNGLKRDLAQRLTEGLQLRHAVGVGGMAEYTV